MAKRKNRGKKSSGAKPSNAALPDNAATSPQATPEAINSSACLKDDAQVNHQDSASVCLPSTGSVGGQVVCVKLCGNKALLVKKGVFLVDSLIGKTCFWIKMQ